MACSNCKRQFYPLPHLFLARDGNGNGPSVCRYCIVADIGIKKALKQYAEEKGIALTNEVAEEWAQRELSKERRSKLVSWAPLGAGAMAMLVALFVAMLVLGK